MGERLANGLTPEQDAAMDRLAEALAAEWPEFEKRLRAPTPPDHIRPSERTEP